MIRKTVDNCFISYLIRRTDLGCLSFKIIQFVRALEENNTNLQTQKLFKVSWKGPVCAPLALWQICFSYYVHVHRILEKNEQLSFVWES